MHSTIINNSSVVGAEGNKEAVTTQRYVTMQRYVFDEHVAFDEIETPKWPIVVGFVVISLATTFTSVTNMTEPLQPCSCSEISKKMNKCKL